ncbi:ABC transporter permease [Gluconobacter kanchanaburiensis]|uniref:Peptide ABC transporter n=1 Tax=Gluconobacter kanchanaburiensis NBRC 103587 TaxID=1307948 RepID=A0A511BAV3_9PROT|nr:ABC transporter permease [Gluconobacter kanchanaburiensis]MBF0862594.1 ABC transporter permease [Gluconobacter kanchanaburiensis]GBR71959.1 peptide ABC transporter permease [Gluconobacter kanchanaburiensis NBRC 103587]GEK96911.1 peptide ABC transporter [Gluconobacter kanchanaburiensis NBRC 103587]
MTGQVFLRFLSGRMLLLLSASLIIFLAMNLLPGDPAAIMLGLDADPASVLALHHQLGLDRPLAARYLHWIGDYVHGNFGRSSIYDVPVSSLITERLQASLPLVLSALALALGTGIPAGLMAAANRGRMMDTALMGLLQFLKSVPDFWLAMMMTFVFSITLHWLPSSGFPGWQEGIAPAVRALALPAVALAIPQAAITARFMRSSLIDILAQDFVRTARAQGYSRRAVLWRIALPNALIPVLTLAGIQFPVLITGSIIVESVFNFPGCGKLLLEAVNQRDIPVVQNLVMMIVTGVIVLNVLVTAAVRWLDPRLEGERP